MTSLNEHIWKNADMPRLRQFVRIQDFQFQAVMRAELAELAAERGKTLQPRRRDILSIEPSAVPLVEPAKIIAEVCNKHNVTRGELLGPQRQARIVRAREEVAYRMKRETRLSLLQIGRKLGGKDHTTVLVAIRRYEARKAGAEE